MKNKIHYVGLDVHKESITIGVAEEGGADPEILSKIPNEVNILLKHLRKLGAYKSLKCCYALPKK